MIVIPYAIMAIEDDSDREFMSNLFASYHRLMYHEIIKILHDPWATEDVLQTTLVNLIDKIDTLRSLSTKKRINYIITASKNTAISHLSKHQKLPTVPFDDWLDTSDQGTQREGNPELFVLRQETLSHAAEAWKKLDPRSQAVLSGRHILGKTNAELAEELGIKPESVRMALTRARRELLEHLKELSGG